jgi:Abnormal spindle-like microcephaly-assoc'd, ASPM-SPD-2-Hydin
LNALSSRGSWACSLLIAAALISLTGCQTLGNTGSPAPGSLAANPASVSFGNVKVGSNQTVPVKVTNTGGVSVTVSSATTTGSGFSFTGPNLPLTLGAGQATTFNAVFAPTVAGNATGSLTVNSNANNPTLSIPLSGTGVAQGQLTPNPASLSFGNVVVGSNKSLTETLTNSGGASLTISAASASGAGFSLSGLTLPLTLNAGQSTSFSVKFAPAVAGAVSGKVTITSDGSNSTLSIPLSGTGVTQGTLAPHPPSLAFGSVQVGSSANLSETLTNTGGSTVTISQANVTGAGFSVSGLTLPATLTPSQSVTFTAIFAPTAAGAINGTLAIVSDASNSPLNIALSGTGAAQGQLSVSPGTLSFGNVVVGTNASLNGSLNATGASVTISSASINSAEFSLSGITLPVTLAVGQTAPFTVTFTPNISGTANASLSFASNASNSPTVQSLTGNGTAPPQHYVDLTWDASNSAVGYNIYRGSVSGGPYSKINSSLDGTLAYTDSDVSAGQTLYYVVTAVDADQFESGYSNEAKVVVPSP